MHLSRYLRQPTSVTHQALAVAVLSIGVLASSFAPFGSASAVAATAVSQTQLEQEINSYAALLGQLGNEIEGPAIAAAHRHDLDALSAAATQEVDNLVAKIQIDTSQAQLSADAAAIAKLRPLFAVLTPQVFETVEADDQQQQYNALYLDQQRLKPLLPILRGSAGYDNAVTQYQNLVASVQAGGSILTHIATGVLTQSAAGFPGNISVFTKAAANLQKVQLDLSHAAHDEAILGLAFGGYRGD